jgi:hypothetical protein
LAGDVFASHYAEPVIRTCSATMLRSGPSDEANAIRSIEAGEHFAMLEDSLGWAWGYAESDHRVGYVHSDALTR